MLAASPLLRAARPIVRLRLGRPSSSTTTTTTPPPPRANPAVPARRPTEPRTVSSVRSPSSTPKASAKVDSDYSPFLLLLAAVPVTCAYLAYWQVGRLKWKVELIEELELNLGRKAINLPDEIEHSVLPEFNYRKVALRGSFPALDTPGLPPPILVGPRILDGEPGYQVIMPFLRSPSSAPAEASALPDNAATASSNGAGSGSGWFGWLSGGESNSESSTGRQAVASKPVQHEPKPILVNLGFVPSSLVQPFNLDALRLPVGEVELEGMLRNEGLGKLSSAKKGKPTSWTPDNDEKGRNWYWVDIERFAEYFRNDSPAGGWGEVEPVLVDVIYDGNAPKSALLETGEPVGRPPKIELRNQHAVYAFTWTSISAITSALLWRVWKTGRVIKPRSGHGGR